MHTDISEKILVCVAEKFILGGVETYYVRMLQWASERKYKLILMLPEGAQIVDEWKDELKRLDVTIWFYTNNIFNIRIRDVNGNNADVSSISKSSKTVICDNLHTYVAASYIAQKYNWENANISLYILHPEMSRCSERKLLNIGYKNLILKGIVGNGLIFMDEQTLSSFESYYKVDVANRVKLLRVGQKIPPKRGDRSRNKDSFMILSICRMDFPFKGYVVGLVDVFEQLKDKYPQIKMTLIGDGPQYDELLSKLNQVDEEKRKDIHLIKSVPYEQIDQHMKQCDIYVGMGTTLLDAAKLSKIGIIAAADQYLPVSSGYFFESRKITAFYGEENYDDFNIYDLVENVIICSDEEYLEWCDRSYEAVKEEYDLNAIMEEIVAIKTQRIGKFKMCSVKLYDSIILLLKRIAGMR